MGRESSKMVFVKSFHRRWAIVLVVSFHAAVRRVAGYGSPSSVASLKHLKPVKCLRGRKIGRSGAKVALKAQESQQHERANEGRANLVDDAQPSSVINQSPSYTPLASSMALVAGNAVGAGVLALPETSFPAGFGPSAVALCVTWIGSVATGLLVAEAMLNYQQPDGSGSISSRRSPDAAATAAAECNEPSLYAVADQTLGKAGGMLACGTFVALNYALLVAYFSKGGEIIADIVGILQNQAAIVSSLTTATSSTAAVAAAATAAAGGEGAAGTAVSAASGAVTATKALVTSVTLDASPPASALLHAAVSEASVGRVEGSSSSLIGLVDSSPGNLFMVPFASAIGLFVFKGSLIRPLVIHLFRSEEQQAALMKLLLVVLMVSFGALLAALLPGLNKELLWRSNPGALPRALPVLVLSLVFHNVVPTIVAQQGGDPSRIRKAIIGGSLLPLTMYLLFNFASLGAVPADSTDSVPHVISDILTANAAAFMSSGDSGSSGQMPAVQSLVAAVAASAAALLLPVFSLTSITSSLFGTAVSQVDELSALLSKKAAPSGSEPAAAASAAAAYVAYLETGVYQPEPGRPAEMPDSGSNEEDDEGGLNALLAGLVFVPPLALDLCSQENVFEAALDFGGTYGDLTLFGLIPVGMVWSQRSGYAKQRPSSSNSKETLLSSANAEPTLIDDVSVDTAEMQSVAFTKSSIAGVAGHALSETAGGGTICEEEDVLVPGGYPILVSLAGASALLIATYSSEILEHAH